MSFSSPPPSPPDSVPEKKDAIGIEIDSIIEKLLKTRTGNAVELSYEEIRGICLKVSFDLVEITLSFSRLVKFFFRSQLFSKLKLRSRSVGIYTGNTWICSDSLRKVVFLQNQTTYFWETTSTEEINQSKQSASYSLTKSS